MLFNRVFKVCKLFSNAILRRANQRRFSSQLRCGSVMSETLEMRQMMSAAPADVSFAGRGEDLPFYARAFGFAPRFGFP